MSPTARITDVPFRNVAIVAHVDHGKTTLVDAMLRQSGALHHRGDDTQERIMDSGDLEKEKGITILAKNTAVHRHHPDGTVTVINVIDTPGHADFGGEVERGLSMVDGVLLLVDASEGPLPQTRFVLRKALAAHLPVILVVNKTDRPDARIAEVVEASHDLLLDVASDLDDEAAAAAEHALGLPTLYASGRAGVASTTAPADGQIPDGTNLDPLFDVLMEHIPAPSGDPEAPLQALVTNLDASTFLGRLALIRIYNGKLRKGQQVAWMREVDGLPVITSAKITELLATEGVERTATDEAIAGDIVAVAGLPEIMIGDTLADPDHAHALPRITVDEPAISVTVGTNTSPLAGKVSGHKLTARMVRNRLDAELVGNVSIRVVDIGRARRVGGAGPRRAGAGRAGRADAPGGLRTDRGQAAGRHPDHRRSAARAVRGDDDRLPRRVRRRDHPVDGRPQGTHGRDDQSRGRLGPDGLHRAQPRPDRLPHRLPHPHPRHRHRQRRVRRLSTVGGGDPGPAHRVAGLRPVRHHHAVRACSSSPTGASSSSSPGRRPMRAWSSASTRARRISTSTSPGRRSSPTCGRRPPTSWRRWPSRSSWIWNAPWSSARRMNASR